MSAARAFAPHKPIVAYKAGRFPASAEAASVPHRRPGRRRRRLRRRLPARGDRPRGARSRTSSTSPSCWPAPAAPRRAAWRRHQRRGPGRDGRPTRCSPAAASSRRCPPGRRSAPRRCHCRRLVESTRSTCSATQTRRATEPRAGRARPTRARRRPGVLTPQAMTDPVAVADAVGSGRRSARKPLLAAWMGGPRPRRPRALSRRRACPPTPPRAGRRAFMDLVEHARTRTPATRPRARIPVRFALDRGRVQATSWPPCSRRTAGTLSEVSSKALLEAYGIPVTRRSGGVSRRPPSQGRAIGYPVVLKVRSPDMSHKTDVGGVVTGLRGPPRCRRPTRRS